MLLVVASLAKKKQTLTVPMIRKLIHECTGPERSRCEDNGILGILLVIESLAVHEEKTVMIAEEMTIFTLQSA